MLDKISHLEFKMDQPFFTSEEEIRTLFINALFKKKIPLWNCRGEPGKCRDPINIGSISVVNIIGDIPIYFNNRFYVIELKFKKSKLRLNEVKTNKEYQAVMKEIEELKELTFQKEEVVIKWMEDIEIQENECADNNVRWEESQREYKRKEKDFIQRMKELDEKIREFNEERVQLSQKVDKDLLQRYNSLRENLKGQVIVLVIDAVCQGCNLGIPPQQYNDLMKGNSMRSCSNCNRIIYWGGDRET